MSRKPVTFLLIMINCCIQLVTLLHFPHSKFADLYLDKVDSSTYF